MTSAASTSPGRRRLTMGCALAISITLALSADPPTARAAAATAPTRTRTRVLSTAERDRLVGARLLSLQWISWEKFGRADIRNDQGLLRISGEQALNGDYVRIKGTITEVADRRFTFVGRIETRVSYINDGDPCVRQGTYEFRRTGARKYWRMQAIDNPCDEVADYVDVYLSRAA